MHKNVASSGKWYTPHQNVVKLKSQDMAVKSRNCDYLRDDIPKGIWHIHPFVNSLRTTFTTKEIRNHTNEPFLHKQPNEQFATMKKFDT
jgi:hypothetical protein